VIKHYFKIAWRNLWKRRTDTLINLSGFCVAFTCALLLLLSVGYEFSYDKFHANADNIYHLRLMTQRTNGTETSNAMPSPLMPALKNTYPEIAHATRLISTGAKVKYRDKEIFQDLRLADSDFFSMFSFPIVHGNTSSPLNNLNAAVISKGAAKAIFGGEDPIGKAIEMQLDNEWKPYFITAVTEDLPANSSITYDIVARFESHPFYPKVSDKWNSRFHDVFIQLKKEASVASFEKGLPAFINQHFADDIMRLKRDGVHPASDGSWVKIVPDPLLSVHTDPESGMSDTINRNYLYLLSVVAVLIVAIACINFVNLTIGRSLTRSKEVGLRKTLGALKGFIILQFWVETMIICFIAFSISCLMAWLLLPQYKLLFDMHVRREILQSPAVWVCIAVVAVVITLTAGGYPAWQMARLKVVEVLRGHKAGTGANSMRNGLIAFQFTITILLVSCTLISWQQLYFLRTMPLGYNTSQVISVPVAGGMDGTKTLQLMRNELSSNPSVENISGIYDNLGKGTDGSSRSSVMSFDYKGREIKSNWMGVSYDFVKTIGLELLTGRDFSPAFTTDSSAVVINEEMAKEIGEKQIIGARLPVDSAKPLTVIGVVKKFNFKSLRTKVQPLTLVLDKNFAINYILVKLKPGIPAASMALMKDVWKKVAGSNPFQASFLDDNINRQYHREEKLTQVFSTGAVVAIALSVIGLLAMVILVVSQRTKEIGIRRVFGASVIGIVQLIARDFLWLVLLGAVIATPIAWYTMSKWLENFAYRIDIGWYIFLAAGLLSIVVALLTISMQAVKAAMANPVKSLRTE
jgi:ABC-type antimicrobial peptide transport system permease subunit